MKKTLIVGDVHGCGLELHQMIHQVNPTEIILVGDVFDRAPFGTVVWELIQEHNIKQVLGNHEVKFINFLEGKKDSVPPHYTAFLNQFVGEGFELKELYDYLKSLPTLIKINDNSIVAHAGANLINPFESDFNMNVYGRIKSNSKYKEQSKTDWGESYAVTEHTAMVFYGHVSHTHIISMRNSICLDTAACHGNSLSGIILETMQHVSVPAQMDYFLQLKTIFKKDPPVLLPVISEFINKLE